LGDRNGAAEAVPFSNRSLFMNLRVPPAGRFQLIQP